MPSGGIFLRAKDIIVLVIAFLFLALPVKVLGTEIVNEHITADDYVYDTVLAVEKAQIQLTDSLEEKVRILHRSSERLILLVNQTNDHSKLNRLLDDYNEHDSFLWEIWKNLDAEEADILAELFLEIRNDLASKRATLANNKFLPEQAQAGIAMAQENQEKALKNHNEALEKAKENIEKAEVLPDKKVGLPASPGLLESAPGRAGETPGLSSSTPGLSDSEPPGQAESTPGQSGSTPGQSDSEIGRASCRERV